MTTDKQRAKANDYLTTGRVCTVEVSTQEGYGEFLIAGTFSEPYRVVYQDGRWGCDCPARVLVCAHVLACQTITKFEAVKPIVSLTGDDDASIMMAEFLKG